MECDGKIQYHFRRDYDAWHMKRSLNIMKVATCAEDRYVAAGRRYIDRNPVSLGLTLWIGDESFKLHVLTGSAQSLACDYFTSIQNNLKSIDRSLPEFQKEQWHDVVQRTHKAHFTICEQPQKLNGIINEKNGDERDFGDDIRAAAEQLVPKETTGQGDGQIANA